MKNLLVSLILLLSFGALAKPHMIAEVGDIECLSRNKDNSDILERLGVTLDGESRKERELVTRAVNTIVEMTNEQQAERLLSGLTVRFKDILGNTSAGGCMPAHQLVRNEIYLGRYCVGMKGQKFVIPGKDIIFVHEVAHFIANKRGYYSKYNKEVSKTCKLSNYMTKMSNGKKIKNRNEEFAEVFAAYLTYGNKLRRSCRKSFNWMKDNLFLGSEPSCN